MVKQLWPTCFLARRLWFKFFVVASAERRSHIVGLSGSQRERATEIESDSERERERMRANE